jgi:hypothetical protein
MTGLERNARGLLLIGPQFVTPSDVIVKQIEQAKLSLTRDSTDAKGRAVFKANILEERRARRLTTGRIAAQRSGRRVRPWECVL